MPLVTHRNVKKYSNRKVFGGAGLWSKIKGFARRIFGSSKGRELINKGADQLIKKAPGLLTKGLEWLTKALPEHKVLNPGGANAKKLFDMISPHVDGFAKKGINAGRKAVHDGLRHEKVKPEQDDVSIAQAIPELAGEGLRKRPRKKRVAGGGLVTAKLSKQNHDLLQQIT